jgi:hypothetical protein
VLGDHVGGRSETCDSIRLGARLHQKAVVHLSGHHSTSRQPYGKRVAVPSRCLLMPKTATASDGEYLHCDPALHFGQVDTDATFAFPCTHVNRGPACRLAQPTLNLRLRLMAGRTVVSGRRTYVAFRLHHDRAPVLCRRCDRLVTPLRPLFEVVPLKEARVRLDCPPRRTAPLNPMRRRRVLRLGWICSDCACEPSSHRVEPRLERTHCFQPL